MLGDGVQGGGGLVQDDDGPVFVQGPGQHQPLQFPAGEQQAVLVNALADVGGPALGQGLVLFPQPRPFDGVLHAGGVRALRHLGDVVREGGVKH